MNKKTVIFLVIRIIAYVIITSSFLKHGINIWLLITLFLVIELNVWMDYFIYNKEIRKLLKDTKENLKKG